MPASARTSRKRRPGEPLARARGGGRCGRRRCGRGSSSDLLAGLGQQRAQLLRIALRGEQARQHRLRLARAAAAEQGQAVGELQRGVGLALGVVLQQRRRLVPGLGVEPGRGQQPLEVRVRRVVRHRARQGSGRLVEHPRVEVGDAQRGLQLREVGIDGGRPLEKRRRPREPLRGGAGARALGLQHAEVEVGAGQAGPARAASVPPAAAAGSSASGELSSRESAVSAAVSLPADRRASARCCAASWAAPSFRSASPSW